MVDTEEDEAMTFHAAGGVVDPQEVNTGNKASIFRGMEMTLAQAHTKVTIRQTIVDKLLFNRRRSRRRRSGITKGTPTGNPFAQDVSNRDT